MSKLAHTPMAEFVDWHFWFSRYANAKPEEAQIFATMLREKGLAAIDHMLAELDDTDRLEARVGILTALAWRIREQNV